MSSGVFAETLKDEARCLVRTAKGPIGALVLKVTWEIH